VDLLSWLVRAPPAHISPTEEAGESISMANNLASVQESWLEKEPVKRAMFVAWSLSDALKDQKSAFATT
jgi:hypothetical protein